MFFKNAREWYIEKSKWKFSKVKHSQLLVKAVKTDFIQNYWQEEKLSSIQICAKVISFKGRMKVQEEQGFLIVREVKNYQELVSVIVISPAFCLLAGSLGS